MKYLFFANTDWYLFNFRLSLIKSVSQSGNEVILVSPPGLYGERLTALGYNWIPAPMKRSSINILSDIKMLFWIRKLILRENIQLLHSFTIKCVIISSITGIFINKKRRPKLVNAIAGMGYIFTSNHFSAILLKPLIRIIFRYVLNNQYSRLILQNTDDVSFFVQSGIIKPSKIDLIMGSGVDCTKFTPDNSEMEYRFSVSKHMRVLLPCRLLRDKGVIEFIEACKILKEKKLYIDFFIAGDTDIGNPASISKSEIRSWVEEEIITWLGHVEDMPSLYHSVHVVVLPSYREGLPKGLIEAAACGKGLVATDVPGCREVIDHRKNGLLVRVADSIALASAIEELYHNPASIKSMGQNARHKALEDFEESIIINKTRDVFKRLLST